MAVRNTQTCPCVGLKYREDDTKDTLPHCWKREKSTTARCGVLQRLANSCHLIGSERVPSWNFASLNRHSALIFLLRQNVSISPVALIDWEFNYYEITVIKKTWLLFNAHSSDVFLSRLFVWLFWIAVTTTPEVCVDAIRAPSFYNWHLKRMRSVVWMCESNSSWMEKTKLCGQKQQRWFSGLLISYQLGCNSKL